MQMRFWFSKYTAYCDYDNDRQLFDNGKYRCQVKSENSIPGKLHDF